MFDYFILVLFIITFLILFFGEIDIANAALLLSIIYVIDRTMGIAIIKCS